MIYELNIAVTEESERSAKLGSGKAKSKVSKVQVTTPIKRKREVKDREDLLITEKLLAEIQSLKSDVTALKENWNKQLQPDTYKETPKDTEA